MMKLNYLTKFMVSVAMAFSTLMFYAQEGADLNVDVNVKKPGDAMSNGDWMSNPLVWVIGALVLILIIALVARGGGKSE